MKVSIVFEETENVEDGVAFKVYLEGISKSRSDAISRMSAAEQVDELSTAEYWAMRCMSIVAGALQQSGAVRSVKRRSDG